MKILKALILSEIPPIQPQFTDACISTEQSKKSIEISQV